MENQENKSKWDDLARELGAEIRPDEPTPRRQHPPMASESYSTERKPDKPRPAAAEAGRRLESAEYVARAAAGRRAAGTRAGPPGDSRKNAGRSPRATGRGSAARSQAARGAFAT